MPEIAIDDAIEIMVIEEMLTQHENFMSANMQLDALTMQTLDDNRSLIAFLDTEIAKHEYTLV